ncbi:unnamed protein product [Menidia menidia]|uniref:(Atlantic silverside) hypothetical protein n=1 Tax=Menidia menidia TaxID=238744 RepID=A0A8S4B3P7_9TELE|nr:unnamed protein product [Menidia menidia]
MGDKVTHPIAQSTAQFGVGLQVKMSPGSEGLFKSMYEPRGEGVGVRDARPCSPRAHRPLGAAEGDRFDPPPPPLFVLSPAVLACSMAAAVVRGAPLPGASALVEEPKFQELLQRVHSLTQKMLLSIPDTHRSCVQTETLKLNSSENAKLVTMASIIGIPPAPVLKAVSENFTLESSLERMSEGLHLHRSLLLRVSPRLERADKVASLMADIRDLAIQIVKMQKMLQPEAEVQQAPDPLDLRLPGNYEVQVAVHMTLVQLQSFGRDMMRCLGSLDQGSEEDTEI